MKPELNNKHARILAVIGTAFSVIAVISALYTYCSIKAFKRAQGTVVSLDYTGDGIYFPIVLFNTVDGRVIRSRSVDGSQEPEYSVGSNVTVLYSMNDPYRFRLSSFKALWFFAVVFAGMGGIFFFGALIYWSQPAQVRTSDS